MSRPAIATALAPGYPAAAAAGSAQAACMDEAAGRMSRPAIAIGRARHPSGGLVSLHRTAYTTPT